MCGNYLGVKQGAVDFSVLRTCTSCSSLSAGRPKPSDRQSNDEPDISTQNSDQPDRLSKPTVITGKSHYPSVEFYFVVKKAFQFGIEETRISVHTEKNPVESEIPVYPSLT